MKVLDLQCAHGHPFEGWFASEDDYQSQHQRGLLACPMCGDTQITKKLSAPRINLGAAAPASACAPSESPSAAAHHSAAKPDARHAPSVAPPQGSTPAQPGGSPAGGLSPARHAAQALASAAHAHAQGDIAQLHAAWLRLSRQIVAQTEDVGPRFAEEARKIHHGDAQDRAIRGRATAQQARQLLEEGIDILPLPLPDAAKETLQ